MSSLRDLSIGSQMATMNLVFTFEGWLYVRVEWGCCHTDSQEKSMGPWMRAKRVASEAPCHSAATASVRQWTVQSAGAGANCPTFHLGTAWLWPNSADNLCAFASATVKQGSHVHVL